MSQFLAGSAPGFTAIQESVEWAGFMNAPGYRRFYLPGRGVLDSTAVDAGNTPTTTLRGGLIIGVKASDGNLYQYDPDGTDGTQNPVGVLDRAWSMLDAYGTVEDKNVAFLRGADLIVSELANDDLQARNLLWKQGFRFDEDLPAGVPYAQVKPIVWPTVGSGTVTLTNAHHGRLCAFNEAVATGSGVVLPTLEAGLQIEVLQCSDNNLVITAAANTILYGDAGGALATSITISTTNKKMGGRVELTGIYVAGALRWAVRDFGTALTVA